MGTVVEVGRSVLVGGRLAVAVGVIQGSIIAIAPGVVDQLARMYMASRLIIHRTGAIVFMRYSTG
jgi:hypothetical protein